MLRERAANLEEERENGKGMGEEGQTRLWGGEEGVCVISCYVMGL